MDARRRLATPSKEDEELATESRQVARLRAQVSDSKRIHRHQLREIEDLEHQVAMLLALDKRRAPKPIKVKRRAKRTVTEGLYFQLLSDLHFGEHVRLDQTQGRNEYNIEIAQERLERCFRQTLHMLNTSRTAWNIPQMLLWLGGDFISGSIHDELEETNDTGLMSQALIVYDSVRAGIDLLLAEGDLEKLLIPCNSGNHGRVTEKMRISSGEEHCLEWLIYRMLERWYQDEDRIEFQIANGYNNIVEMFPDKRGQSLRLNLHHGQALRGGKGIGGIAIPAANRVAKSAMGLHPDIEGTTVAPAHFYMWGHFHHELRPTPNSLQNGSLIGASAYSEFLGVPPEIAPAQMAGVFDADRRLLGQVQPIWTSEIRPDRKRRRTA